jgi:hypothetical protein
MNSIVIFCVRAIWASLTSALSVPFFQITFVTNEPTEEHEEEEHEEEDVVVALLWLKSKAYASHQRILSR